MRNFQAYVASFIVYLWGHSRHDPSFIAERDVAIEIVKLMCTPTPTVEEFEEIARLLKSLDSIDHYDGSGWAGFRMAVLGWLREHGADADLRRDVEHSWTSRRADLLARWLQEERVKTSPAKLFGPAAPPER